MTEKKLAEALELQDQLKRAIKSHDDMQELFRKWDDLHKKTEKWDYKFVDKNKEWEVISQIASEWDSIRDVVVTEVIHQARIKQRELRERIKELQKKFEKL